MPFIRRLGSRMHQEHAVDTRGKRQLLQPFALPVVEMLASPGGGHVSPGRSGEHRVQGKAIVIAAQDNRTFSLQLATAFDHLGRMRAVADQIAQNRNVVMPLLTGVRETGIEGRKIGVQIRKQCEFQAGLSGIAVMVRPRITCRTRKPFQQTVAVAMPGGNCARSNSHVK